MANKEFEYLLDYCQTERQREIIKVLCETNTQGEAAAVLGIALRNVQAAIKRIRGLAAAQGHKEPEKEIAQKEEKPDLNRKLDELSGDYHNYVSKDRFNIIVTAAQNGTPVHQNFWNNLKSLSEKTNSKILVIPFRYKNPTSVFKDYDQVEWDSSLHNYLCEDDFKLNDNLSILANLKMQPTAVRPLSGLEQVSGSSSAIFGSSKLELKSIATPANRLPKTLVSTGACTVPNYTDSKAGYKGEKRHSLSAILVEVSGKSFFMRQVIADEDGNFIDLLTEYKDGKSSKAPQAQVLSTGDLHGVNSDYEAVNATFFNDDSMLKYFKPRYVTLDDTLDFQCASHHTRNDPVERTRLFQESLNSVEQELKATFDIINNISSPYTQIVIKRSNHDEHFERWIKETDPRWDPVNYKVWCEAYPLMIEGVDVYEYFASKWLPCFDDVTFLKRDESFVVAGVSHDGHGDIGANGSRGSLLGFTKLGCAGQWGHSHTAGIMDDQYQNGTLSKLRMNYNRGPSSWTHCNTIQYANGKRSLLFIIDGKWRFEE